MTIAELLRQLPKRSRGDAVWLLSAFFKISPGELQLDSRRMLGAEEELAWRKWWKRRMAGEPLQFISGLAPFYGREFIVNPKVLIPRPETERLVELALGLMKNFENARVLDVGTGSGAIALTMHLERPSLEVVGSDASSAALSVAKKNATTFGLVDFRLEKHDLFSAKLRKEKWDLLVSNPPYLDFRKDKIASDVKSWEPRMALEPQTSSRVPEITERAAWCAERILLACELSPPRFTALELSPRVAIYLERRWKKRAAVRSVWREADLAGRKRFLLVEWNDG